MKVLIIPEDFRKDQYMLKPIVEAMLVYLDGPRSKVNGMANGSGRSARMISCHLKHGSVRSSEPDACVRAGRDP